MNKTIINTGITLLIMVVGTAVIKSTINAEKIFERLFDKTENEKKG